MNEGFSVATLKLEGGGRIGLCPLPGRAGNLASDLTVLFDWQPKIVVSMTEQAEMEKGGSGGLGAKLANAGIDWFHFPIRDYGVPTAASKTAWQALSARLHSELDGSGAIGLHCWGGRGRSGMVALRILVERGIDPQIALCDLRAVRPGAVETDPQLAWGLDR